jgi:hypothetical protein
MVSLALQGRRITHLAQLVTLTTVGTLIRVTLRSLPDGR